MWACSRFQRHVRDGEDVTHQPVVDVHAAGVAAAVGGAHADVVDGVEVGGAVGANELAARRKSRERFPGDVDHPVATTRRRGSCQDVVHELDPGSGHRPGVRHRPVRRTSTPTGSASSSTTTPVINDDIRIVQLTPPGSGCSIVIGKGAVPDMPPGSAEGPAARRDRHRTGARRAGGTRRRRSATCRSWGRTRRRHPDPTGQRRLRVLQTTRTATAGASSRSAAAPNARFAGALAAAARSSSQKVRAAPTAAAAGRQVTGRRSSAVPTGAGLVRAGGDQPDLLGRPGSSAWSA